MLIIFFLNPSERFRQCLQHKPRKSEKTVSVERLKNRGISETNFVLKFELWVLILLGSEEKGMKRPQGVSYSLTCKMIGLGRPALLNSEGYWKCVEAFLVGGGGQWAGMLGGGAFRIYGWSQEFKTSHDA